MPCNDYGGPVHVEYRDNPDMVVMLCSALRTIEKAGLTVPRNCSQWWEAHKREDAAREAAEKRRLEGKKKKDAVLAKLSDEDKRILGLK